MKKFIRSFSALTLCVLCLISMVALIFAVESNICPEGGSHYYGTTVDCNNWYNFRYYLRSDDDICYQIWNDRCIKTCMFCGSRAFVSHQHPDQGVFGHEYIVEDTHPDLEVCNVCSYTKPLD